MLHGTVLPPINTHLPTTEQVGSTIAQLAGEGAPLAVEVEAAVVHLHPLRPFTTEQYVHARRAFMAVTDCCIVWHDPVSAA